MATLQERLTEAEAAYHDLLLGKALVEVRDGNGETIRYSVAKSGSLIAYIADLKRQIFGVANAPMRVWF